MRELSDLYNEEYLNIPTQAGNQVNPILENTNLDEEIEYEDLDFDLNDELNQETYYAGGDEGDSRNKTKPKISKKKKKTTMKESFRSLAASLLNEEFDGNFGDDDLDMGDDFGGDDEFGGDEEDVTIPASTLRDIISQLEGLIGGGSDEFDDEGFEDDFEDDEFGDDEFPTESWDGGNGAQRLNGDYSGKPKPLKASNLQDRGRAKTGAKPNRSEGGSTGDQRLRGDTSGKAKRDGGTNFTQGGNANKGNAKTNFRKANPSEDLFG
jgi:hypothetical protein